MPTQTDTQRQAAFTAAGQQPAAAAPVSPAPQLPTSAAPGVAQQTPPVTVNVNQNPPQDASQDQNPASGATQIAPPTTQLQPGSTGQDVQKLQNYLSQMGYLTPDQIGTGAGTYGPQTTAAVAKLQKDLGINPSSGSGFYGPQTQQALSQKYQGLFSSVQNTQAPDSGATARSALQGALAEQSAPANNPVFGSLASSMGPIMQSLNQVLSNINNPALSAVSLQQEYASLREQYQLPEMNSELMNMNRIMNGTVDDIRNEVTAAGGFATESQVQGIAAARNKTIMKQYNSLSTQYDAAQQNVQSMMQYAQTDQSNSLQRSQLTASVTESLASIQNQMLTMGMTMQNNARQAAQYNVTQMGYKGLANSVQGNPEMAANYENLLGLAPGTLTNPTALAQMDTYKDQTLQLNNYKAAITAYNAGAGPIPTSPPSTLNSQYGTATSTVTKITGYDPNSPLSQINPQKLALALIQNEGSSPSGVMNNPGNIKFVGLPGQINSGVKAQDGGTFASYSTLQVGQQAIQNNITKAMNSNPSMTLGSFVDRYTNTAPSSNNLPIPVSSPGQVGITPVDSSTLVRPPFVANGVPLSMSADDMTSYMNIQKSAYADPGTNNIVAPGVGYYLHQSDGSYVLKSALPSPVDSQYQNLKSTMDNAGVFKGSPSITRKWTLSANSAISSFKDTGTYKVASNVAPYLAAIHAAINNPGDKSISDFELLDSFVKAAKGGVGQVTDSQINVMLQGASLGDRYDKTQQKLQQGGVLSTAQREALVSLADETYKRNLQDYQKGYVQALQAMHGQGIPPQFWRNLPDFSSLVQ